MKEGRKPFSVLRRSAGEVKHYRSIRHITWAVVGLITLFLVIVYIISLLFNKYGSFTVAVRDVRDNRYSLSLSENELFSNPTSRLNSNASKDITNIDGNTLPDNLNDVNGEHNGDNYVAYTFYVKNSGTLECNFRYELMISRMTAGIDAAARVRVYFNPDFYKAETGEYDYNGSYVDYAKPKTAGNGLPEIDPENRVMTNFVSANTVMIGEVSTFLPGDITKITVVIWLEGNDPDCTDDIMGGEFKLDMTFEILGVSGE